MIYGTDSDKLNLSKANPHPPTLNDQVMIFRH